MLRPQVRPCPGQLARFAFLSPPVGAANLTRYLRAVKQCDDTNKACGCAKNQAVVETTAIAATEVDVKSTKSSDKIFVAGDSAKKWDAAGFTQGDTVVIKGANCAALSSGTAVTTKVTKVTATELTVAASLQAANEDTNKDCTVERLNTLKCVACASGSIFAAADATPQTAAQVCTGALAVPASS